MSQLLRRAAAGAILFASVCGCSSYTRPISVSDQPTGDEAFVYGRFHLVAPWSFLALNAHDAMGFVIRCANEREYRIKFDDVRPIVALALAPSSCWISEIMFTDANTRMLGTKPFPSAFLGKMTFEAGKAYYLGDYDATIADVWEGGMKRQFRVTAMKNRFDGTTRDLKLVFPKLASTPMVNQMGAGLAQGDDPRKEADPRGISW